MKFQFSWSWLFWSVVVVLGSLAELGITKLIGMPSLFTGLLGWSKPHLSQMWNSFSGQTAVSNGLWYGTLFLILMLIGILLRIRLSHRSNRRRRKDFTAYIETAFRSIVTTRASLLRPVLADDRRGFFDHPAKPVH